MAAATVVPASAVLMAQPEVKAGDRDDERPGRLTKGDAAILRFLAAAEVIESDFWELGGTQANDFASPNPATGTTPTPTGGNANYTAALQLLDGDMPQYILDNTDDEFSHANFLLAYLKSKGANTADLIKAIAFTAGFHFPFIEVHGTSLYPALAQRVSNPEVLRVLLSIGPTETMHFQTWQDKGGNANAGSPPLTVFDPINNSTVTFVDLTTSTDETLQANLIMPEPCPCLNRNLPICSVMRPTEAQGAAIVAAKALIANGLFIGQTPEIFELLADLASDADAARRERED